MRRLHLVELHELPWFPAIWRDLLTDFMTWYATAFRPYLSAVDLLVAALRRSGTNRVVDLCAGGGGALVDLKPALDAALGAPVTLTLTDKFPNRAAFDAAVARFPGEVELVREPVDATSVPGDLVGFRTLFASFHHFAPEKARGILADAAASGQGIAVLEYTERRLALWSVALACTPALIWLATPRIRPRTWRRLLWTYLVPVVPAVALVDGLVSVLRSYTVDELEALTQGLDGDGYRWQIGRLRSLGASNVTYAIGTPAD
jgi:hypothetical protein